LQDPEHGRQLARAFTEELHCIASPVSCARRGGGSLKLFSPPRGPAASVWEGTPPHEAAASTHAGELDAAAALLGAALAAREGAAGVASPALVVSVERGEGVGSSLLLKLAAFSRLLEESPGWRAKVSLVLLVEGGGGGAAGGGAVARANQLVGRLNAALSTPTWAPVTLLRSPSFPVAQIAALYAASAVGFFASRAGGCEDALAYVAACGGGCAGAAAAGALVVGEDMAHARLLRGAHRVNPGDARAVAGALRAALEASPAARGARHAQLRAFSRANSDAAWGGAVVALTRAAGAVGARGTGDGGWGSTPAETGRRIAPLLRQGNAAAGGGHALFALDALLAPGDALEPAVALTLLLAPLAALAAKLSVTVLADGAWPAAARAAVAATGATVRHWAGAEDGGWVAAAAALRPAFDSAAAAAPGSRVVVAHGALAFDYSACGAFYNAFAQRRAAALLQHVVACWVDSESTVECAWQRARGVLLVRKPLLPALLESHVPLLCVGTDEAPLGALGAPCSLCVGAPGGPLAAPAAVLEMLAAAVEGW
jgi:hypothetical protein